MDPQVRYARTADDVSIAYWTFGEGPVLVVTPLVPYSHIEMEWQNPHIRRWYQRLGEFVKVVAGEPDCPSATWAMCHSRHLYGTWKRWSIGRRPNRSL